MDPRRKKIMFRCQHCGMKENDILLGRFAAVHIADLSDQQLERMEALLEEADNDLYNWITGKEPVPAAHDHDLMAWLKKFNNAL
jgi:antitoxin CptB